MVDVQGRCLVADFYLVRHGESLANLDRRFDASPPGAPLSPRGWRQAELVADWFAARAILPDLLLASPFLRTRETARPLWRRSGRPLLLADLLRETSVGLWDGRSSRDMAQDPQYLAWRDDPEVAPPGGGERLSDVALRLMVLLRTLRRLAPDSSAVLFTHQHGLRAALSLTAALRDEAGRLLPVPNCAIAHLGLDSDEPHLITLDTSIHAATQAQTAEAG
jgi:broad specificity phosphatase PhoE